MKFEKFFNSKLFAFFESFYRLLVVNLLTILTIVLGLGIFTLMPALITLIIILRSSSSNTDFSIFKTYFIVFKNVYKKSFLLSLVYLAFCVLLVFNTYYFYCALNDWGGIFFNISYYLILFIDVIFILAYINACFVFVYFPHLMKKKILKYSFVLLQAIALKALIIFAILLASVYLVFLMPYIISFIIVSLDFFIFNLLIERDYLRILPQDMKALDVFDYINKIA